MTNSSGYDGFGFGEQLIDLIILFIILSIFFDHSGFDGFDGLFGNE